MRRAVFALIVILAAARPLRAEMLAGVVRDAVSEAPIARARVDVLGRELSTASAEDGRFTLEAAAWPLTVVVARPGYRVARLELAAPPAQPLVIALEPVVSYSDRIEVTATRAREGLDPATVTNIPAERVREAHWGQDPALLLPELAPGFLSYNDSGNGIGYSYFTVRGFGQARTRVTLNGAPLNDAESGELFFIDLADFLSTAGDVQIGRGVFGLSGIGGSIDITTTPSRLEPSFELRGGLGSFGTRRLVASYDSGLVGGTWALVARYSKIQTDGYREQSWVEMWNSFLSASRFGSRSTLRLVFFGGPEKTHLAYNGIPRSVLEGGLTGNAGRDRRANPIAYPGEIDNFVQPHFQVLHDLQLSPATRLSQTFYAFRGDGSYVQLREGRTLAEYNLPPVVLPDGTAVEESDLVRERSIGEWDYGWVPTLSHKRGPLTLTVAGEVRLHDAHHWGTVKWAQFYPAGIAPDRRYYDYKADKRTLAGGARLAWEPNPRLTLSAGLQLSQQRYRMSADRIRGMAFEESYGFLLPRLGLVVHLGKDAFAYANVARGGREPNFRQIFDPQDYYSIPALGLEPEDVVDYETGLSLARGPWRARVNGYFMDFRNEIVYAGALDDSGVPIYGNGARSRHRGIEAEGSWQAKRLTVEGHLTLSRNTFTEYREHGWDGSLAVYDGNRIAGYPDLMAVLSAKGSLGPAELRLSARHAGLFYLDNSEDSRLDPAARTAPGYERRVNKAYTVVDAALNVELPRRLAGKLGSSRMGLELRVNNLLDRRYTAFGYMDGEPQFIPAATRTVYAGLALGL